MKNAILIPALLVGFSCFAQESSMPDGPCAADAQKLCGDITPGGGRMAACLKAHEDKLSTACRQQTSARINEFRETRKACRGDVEKFCKDVQPGGGRIFGCLRQHDNELSSACKTETRQLQERRKPATDQSGQ